MNEYLFVLSDSHGGSNWRIYRADSYEDAQLLFIDDKDTEGYFIDKVYVRFQ